MPEHYRLPRFAYFLLVGVAGFIVDAGVSDLLTTTTRLGPLAARLPAFLLATVVTYSANRRFTFWDRRTPFLQGWLKYVSSTSLGALLNYVVYLVLVTKILHGPWTVVSAIAAGSIVGLGFNYLCSTRIVFRPQI